MLRMLRSRCVDQRGILLGTALYSPASEIALRLVSTELIASEAEWLELIGITPSRGYCAA